MDRDQVCGVLSPFYYANATCCDWRAVTNCCDFDSQPKVASASTSEASVGSCRGKQPRLPLWKLSREKRAQSVVDLSATDRRIGAMSKHDPVYTIFSKRELMALASSVRQEIIDVLAQMGTVSVAELAGTVRRPADTLYYHLRILKKAGLVIDCGARVIQGRTEALYRARNLNIDYEAARQKNASALTAVASSMLRLGIRDFKEAVRNEDVVVSGNQRELWSARKTGLLTKKKVGDINESIKTLLSSVSPRSNTGQLYGITILLTPLNRHRRPRIKKHRGKKRVPK